MVEKKKQEKYQKHVKETKNTAQIYKVQKSETEKQLIFKAKVSIKRKIMKKN